MYFIFQQIPTTVSKQKGEVVARCRELNSLGKEKAKNKK